MNFNVEVQTARYIANMKRYAAELGYDGKKVVKDQTRFTLRDLQKETPWSSASKARGSLYKHFSRAVDLIEAKNFDNKKIKQMINKKQYSHFNEFAKNAGMKVNVEPYTPQLTWRNMNKRGYGYKRSTAGTLDGRGYRAELKNRQSSLGTMKKSFSSAYQRVGGSSSGWFMRSNKNKGTYIDNINTQNPSFEFVNKSLGIGLWKYKLPKVLNRRSNAMMNDMKKKLAYRTKKANMR